MPPNWTCLQQPIPAAPAGTVEVEFVLTSGSGTASIAGAQVEACNLLDVGCQYPLSPATANNGGVALVTVPGGFSGYYEVNAVNASTFTPAILSRPRQLSSEYAPQSLVTASQLQSAASFVGVTQDPNLGSAVVTVLDCTSTPAAGINLVIGGATGEGEQIVYLENNVPSQVATQTDRVSGSALIFNVPSGTLTVTASFAATGQAILTISPIAREGWVTYVEVRPDQATHQPIPQ